MPIINKLFTLAAGAVFFYICFVTLSPIELRPGTDHVAFERFAGFALLGILAALAFPRHVARVAVMVVLCALGLEALQLLVPTRHGLVSDALIKATGGACGVILARLMTSVHSRIRTGSSSPV